ncbi:restriction endonuclease subunit S [Limosilactobacillus reuteri]|uniref:Restriction endonuclease subunit S n=2 Tax=Limosilactobacillus reuteri TaxID=1598 RepID=A0AAJ1ICH4_LIMRT|nr:restriction endonuclease subunit S [Limosilactobacillus reuteri]MDC6078052.1 restriction endonuclease subunit S [Limosilactobacillus reuteri]MDV8947407.1 restriction endonuclease subunit S [Limosilactobacillus reuteri]
MDKKPEKLVPEVRFKGFTDDWEQHKLGETLTGFEYGLNTPATDYDGINKYLRITDIDDVSHKFDISHLTSPKLKDDNYLLANGDILFARTGASVGKSYRYSNIDGKVYYAGFLIKAHIKDHFSTNFIFDTTLLPRYHYFVQVTSMRSGQPGINAKEYQKYIIYTPSESEQNKISDLILTIQKLIDLQQRKLEQLKLLEKAHQQKLFPNSFQEKPLLRILHGDNSWWNSYIGEVFTERVDKGSSEKLLSVSITDGVYPFDESKRKNNSSDDKHNYKKVFQNDIAYNSMRLWQGALGVSKYEGIVSPAYTVLKPLPNQNSIFYEFMFKNIDMLHIFQRNSQGLTSDTWNLKFNQLQHIKIKTTNLNSQNKIAKLLIKIEELKNNESNYYHNLMTLKKYLLQKLFL